VELHSVAGWSEFDAHILRLAIIRYGCGAWRDINKHFPLKTCGQLNLQTQRLFGQQALAEFQRLHIDPLRVKAINDKIKGFRKNNCLINTGNNLTNEMKKKKMAENVKKFGVPQNIWSKITVPVVLDPPSKSLTVIDDIEKLREMYRCLYDIELRRKQLKENGGDNAANKALKARNKSKAKEDEKTAEHDKNKNKNTNTNKKDEVQPAMDEDTAMALALSMSFEQSANCHTPAIEKKQRSKKKQSTKKKGSKKKKRKKMEPDDDDEYLPVPSNKRVKKK